jgi:hypothetical protein
MESTGPSWTVNSVPTKNRFQMRTWATGTGPPSPTKILYILKSPQKAHRIYKTNKVTSDGESLGPSGKKKSDLRKGDRIPSHEDFVSRRVGGRRWGRRRDAASDQEGSSPAGAVRHLTQAFARTDGPRSPEHHPGRSQFSIVILAVKKRQNECCKVSGSSSRHNDGMLLWRNSTMQVPNDLQFDTETYLLFSIYYEAYGPFKVMDKSAATYVKRFENQLRGMGQVLEWLGLAILIEAFPRLGKPDRKAAQAFQKQKSVFVCRG